MSELEQLQDVLGDLHDAHVLAQELVARSDAGVPVRERSGIRALQRRLVARETLAFERLRAGWLRGASDFFFARLEVIADELGLTAAAPGRRVPA